jgi:membrane protein
MDHRNDRLDTRDAPDPDDDRKPAEISDLDRRSWKFIARKTVREFSADNCLDLAAGLTYYSILAIFPALLVLVSLLGLIGRDQQGLASLTQIAGELSPSATLTVQGVLQQITSSRATGFAVVIGTLAAWWAASGYVGAFGRALNRIYGIPEGRPFYKLRPVMLIITLLVVFLAALVALGLVISGPVAQAVGNALGLGNTATTIWNIVKWPAMILVVIFVVAILYYATPNVRQPRFRWISVGAAIGVVSWIIASVAFGFYVANFGNYNKTYGSLAGVIVFLLWLWLTNMALLFGAEADAEIERGRELQAGIPAEEQIQLPPRDTRASDKLAAAAAKDAATAREIRDQAVTTSEVAR